MNSLGSELLDEAVRRIVAAVHPELPRTAAIARTILRNGNL